MAGQGRDTDAILVTRFLDYATTYRACSPRAAAHPTGCSTRWSNCSSGCTCPGSGGALLAVQRPVPLRRGNAGGLPGQRRDQRAAPRPEPADSAPGTSSWPSSVSAASCSTSKAGGLLPPEVDSGADRRGPAVPVRAAVGRTEQSRRSSRPDEQRYRIAERLRRLNKLGFDADEVVLTATGEGTRLRVRTRVAESGQSSRELFRETGIGADENQARRLLNDVASSALPGAEERPSGVPRRGRASLAAGGLRPGGRRHPRRPARPPATPEIFRGILEPPLVPVWQGRPQRWHHHRRRVLLRHRSARRPPAAARTREIEYPGKDASRFPSDARVCRLQRLAGADVAGEE